jgi:hypothetical protein
MAMADIVGSMGLTLFCNKCVEVFYRFRQGMELDLDEFKRTCSMAHSAFESFKSPEKIPSAPLPDRYPLFNTDEEVMSFAKVVEERSKDAEEILEELIANIESVSDEKAVMAERKRAAETLQSFFDVLGDYSFGATRESLCKNIAAREV